MRAAPAVAEKAFPYNRGNFLFVRTEPPCTTGRFLFIFSYDKVFVLCFAGGGGGGGGGTGPYFSANAFFSDSLAIL